MGVRRNTVVRKVRRRDGKSRLVIDFFYVDANGVKKRYRRDALVQDSAEAARAEARRRQELAARFGNPDVRPAAPTLEAFVGKEFEEHHLPRWKPSTQRRYRELLKQRLIPFFGRRPLNEIGPSDVQGFVGSLATDGVHAKGPMMLLRTVMRCAVASDVLEAAPHIPRTWKDSKKLPEAPSEADLQTLLHGAEHWVATSIVLAAYAGLRSGEVRALEVRDVDLSRNRITLRRAFSDQEVLTPKSGHDRPIPIAGPLREVLARALAGKRPTDRVVLNRAGKTPSRQAVYNAIIALCDRLKVRRWSFHAVRHYFCTALVRRGANVEAIRRLAGHSNLATTQRYVHAAAEELVATIELLSPKSGNLVETV